MAAITKVRGKIFILTVVRGEKLEDLHDWASANDGNIHGKEITFKIVCDEGEEIFYCISSKGEVTEHVAEELDWEHLASALNCVRSAISECLDYNDNDTDLAIRFIDAVVTDDIEMDELPFTYEIVVGGEMRPEEHFSSEDEAAKRMWLNVSMNTQEPAEFLIDKESGTVSFDDENDVLDTELVAYSQFRH